jgi:hypothetical protein
MGSAIIGGCACGAIRYECTTEPLMVVNCHCRDCQRSSGGACSSVVVVTADSLTLRKGDPRYYRVTAESGNIAQRGFCADCGSPLFAGNSNNPHVIALKLGSLDDPSWCQPMIDIWTQSAQPWDVMNPDIPKIPTQPVM